MMHTHHSRLVFRVKSPSQCFGSRTRLCTHRCQMVGEIFSSRDICVGGQLECRALLFVLGARHDLNVIQTNFVKKCLEMFAEIAEQKDDDKKVYEQFGKFLNFVMREDPPIVPRLQSCQDSTRRSQEMSRSVGRSTSTTRRTARTTSTTSQVRVSPSRCLGARPGRPLLGDAATPAARAA